MSMVSGGESLDMVASHHMKKSLTFSLFSESIMKIGTNFVLYVYVFTEKHIIMYSKNEPQKAQRTPNIVKVTSSFSS